MSKIELNVLAKDLDNAVAVTQAAEGNVYVGVLTKNFDTVDEAVAQVKAYTAAGVRVSVGLGAGDPAIAWPRLYRVFRAFRHLVPARSAGPAWQLRKRIEPIGSI